MYQSCYKSKEDAERRKENGEDITVWYDIETDREFWSGIKGTVNIPHIVKPDVYRKEVELLLLCGKPRNGTKITYGHQEELLRANSFRGIVRDTSLRIPRMPLDGNMKKEEYLEEIKRLIIQRKVSNLSKLPEGIQLRILRDNKLEGPPNVDDPETSIESHVHEEIRAFKLEVVEDQEMEMSLGEDDGTEPANPRILDEYEDDIQEVRNDGEGDQIVETQDTGMSQILTSADDQKEEKMKKWWCQKLG
jgi:hypothetical protein